MLEDKSKACYTQKRRKAIIMSEVEKKDVIHTGL